MKGKKTRGLVGLMLAVAMVLTSVNVFAIATVNEPDLKTVETKVIVQKLQIAPTDGTSITNTGEDQQANYAGKKYDKTKYGDVQFTVYKLNAMDVEASKKKGQEIADEVEAAVKNGNPASAYGATEFQAATTVDENGQINFSYTTGKTKQDFKGYFVVVESKSPATVTGKAKPMFVALPWQKRDSKTGEYLKTVYLYPKNKVESPELVLHKTSKAHGENTVNFAGVNFTLYKGEVGEGTVVKADLKTDDSGNIKITDMTVGKYYLVENETTDKVDGVLDDATKYKPKEGVGTYLVSKYAQNDKNNKLYFEITSEGKLVKGADTLFDNLINYERPKIEKTITNDTAGGTFDVGEKIEYKVEVPIADNVKDYIKYEYEDVPEQGLKVDVATVKVKAGDADLVKDTDYTLTPKGDGYIINFIMGAGVTDKVAAQAGKSFVVTYEASITSFDVTSVDNTVNFTYSNGGKDRYDTDTKTVKTYGAKFVKEDGGLFDIGLGDADNRLAGAKFAVVRVTKEGTPQWLYEIDGKYVWKDNKDLSATGNLKILTSNENGEFEIKGLKDERYFLDELEAPVDYELPAENELGVRVAAEFNPTNQEGDLLLNISVTNKRNPDLPMTGSERLLVFSVIGLVIIGCGYVIIRRRRKTDR